MRKHAQFRDCAGHRSAADSFLTGGIKQLEIDAGLRANTDAADQDVLGGDRSPVAEKQLRLASGVTQHVAATDRRELTASRQIRIDDLRHILGRRADSLPGEGHHRDRSGILNALVDFNL